MAKQREKLDVVKPQAAHAISLPKNLSLVADAAAQFGYSQDYVRDLLQQEKIRGQKIGTQWLVDVEDLAEHQKLAKQRQRQGGRPGKKQT